MVATTKKFDPKALLFGPGPVPSATSHHEELMRILNERIRGKRFLLCSGEVDKVVPYRCSKPFVDWFVGAAKAGHSEGKYSVENNIYPGIGHQFSPGMIKDSVRFIVDAVASLPVAKEDAKASKI